MDAEVMFRLSYGLFVVTTQAEGKPNGCIVNTVIQQTDEPKRISLTINKQNFTQGLIEKRGIFNVSILDETTGFATFEHFGFQSGKTVDKFAGWTDSAIADNGIPYITQGCCGYLSARVIQSIDLDSHVLYIADVTDGKILSEQKPMSYAYYHAHVKPKPPAPENTVGDDKKHGVWVCKICGYIYDEEKEGIPFEGLPEDWVCPLCKHGKSDFRKL